MMKKFLLSTITVFGFAGVASAADLAVSAAPYVAPTYDWSGFYLGGFIQRNGLKAAFGFGPSIPGAPGRWSEWITIDCAF